MIKMSKLVDMNFKVGIINMFKKLKGKMVIMCEQMGNFSREMEIVVKMEKKKEERKE